ncbi:MAG: exodeoxyribonuclease VII small subunit [Phascolarctobacterium sp.]|nr:exodeoxyribonuclease VII small subunit [Phascolarctobacterium sp.]
MATKKIAKNIKFEEALAELEEQVRLLEGGDLSLEKSLEAYRHGVELAKVCNAKLTTVRQEVEKIIGEGEDGFETEAFQDLEA